MTFKRLIKTIHLHLIKVLLVKSSKLLYIRRFQFFIKTTSKHDILCQLNASESNLILTYNNT